MTKGTKLIQRRFLFITVLKCTKDNTLGGRVVWETTWKHGGTACKQQREKQGNTGKILERQEETGKDRGGGARGCRMTSQNEKKKMKKNAKNNGKNTLLQVCLHECSFFFFLLFLLINFFVQN